MSFLGRDGRLRVVWGGSLRAGNVHHEEFLRAHLVGGRQRDADIREARAGGEEGACTRSCLDTRVVWAGRSKWLICICAAASLWRGLF